MKAIDVNTTSKLIKATLKTAFPATRFSVRLSKYSGGCSIDASWTDGPTDKQVKRILDRFDGKGFDGMTDMSYDCGERMYKGEKVDFHSGYVRGQREVSRELYARVADRVAYECGLEMPELNQWGHVADHNLRVPFQWHQHWLESPKEYLTMADLETAGHLLAHDSHEGEYLSRLIDRIAQYVSLEAQQPVELPEYIDLEEKASTGRSELEEPMQKFAGHEALENRV